MAAAPAKISSSAAKGAAESKGVVLQQAANEFVFAVVGHVGSGTSEIATALKGLLSGATGGSFDVEILKAREVIRAWAVSAKLQTPTTGDNDLATVQALQDLGDKMRFDTKDYAAVAKELILKIRRIRADKTGIKDPGEAPVRPDGTHRAYILDSIRHPAEVQLLRHVYQEAFVLVGVVCEENIRLTRLTKKYTNAGTAAAAKLMQRDAKAVEKHGQRVSDAFHMADFFVDNTADRSIDGEPNPDWDINEVLSRLIKIIRGSEVTPPTMAETAMFHADGAARRSACLSRQVGAAIVDARGGLVSTGANEVPRAGGGVYGERPEEKEDHRCAFRKTGRYCSNTREQNSIVDELVDEIPELKGLGAARKNSIKAEIRSGRVGDLLEFSRAIHAEIGALLSAGREGASTAGCRVFVTTFPCHYCARGILAAGVDEVQFIEPYPKSRALALHADAITVSSKDWKAPSVGGSKVLFRPFTGVTPRLYRRAFLKDRELKDSMTGDLIIGSHEWGTPWHLRAASYIEIEAALAKST